MGQSVYPMDGGVADGLRWKTGKDGPPPQQVWIHHDHIPMPFRLHEGLIPDQMDIERTLYKLERMVISGHELWLYVVNGMKPWDAFKMLFDFYRTSRERDNYGRDGTR